MAVGLHPDCFRRIYDFGIVGKMKHWPEVLIFGIIAAMLINNTAPDMTWINTDSDGIHYVYAAKYLYVAHKSSAPLFLLLGHLFLKIPFGTEFWRMALMSAIATSVSSVFVYLIAKHFTNRWYGLLASVIFGGSALVISQSTIVESYALITMLSLLGMYFAMKGHYTLASVSFGAGLAIHPIVGFTAIPVILLNKKMRHWKQLVIMASFLVFYLYNPLVARFNPPPNDMWSNLTVKSEWLDFISTAIMLAGGLAIYDLPKRLLDFGLITTVSLGLTVIPIVIYFVRQKKAVVKDVFFWLFIIPCVFFIVNLAPQTYVYLMPAIAFGAVITVISLRHMGNKWIYGVAAVAPVLFVFNTNYFDIGRTLDPNLSASKYYHEELAKIPDGEIIVPYNGWEWAAVYSYNKNEGRNIIPVSVDTVVSPLYRNVMDDLGVKYKDVGVATMTDVLDKQNALARSIVELNDVWVTVPTDSTTYGAKVIRANHDISLVEKIPVEPPGQWHWKPSDPYGFITGSIEVTEWTYITLSNRNMVFYMGIIIIWLLIDWILSGMHFKRKHAKENITTTD
jgi:hypothetical protein